MHKNIKLFLFTCVYNGKEYIKKLFDSLLLQTSNEFIHYIYDDGSNDDISQIVEQYIKLAKNKTNSYQVIYERCNENKGSLYATQHCLEKMKDYRDCTHFGWANADDWVSNNYIEQFIKLLNKTDKYEIIFALPIIVKQNNENISYKKIKKQKIDKNGFKMSSFLQNSLSYYPFVASIDFFVTNKMTLLLKPKSDCFYNDIQTIFMYACKNAKFYYINKNIYYLLKRDDSISYGHYFDVYKKECFESLYALSRMIESKIDILELQQNISIFNQIKINKEITRKEIAMKIKRYKLFKKENREINCSLLYKFRIFCFLISPKLARLMYKIMS